MTWFNSQVLTSQCKSNLVSFLFELAEKGRGIGKGFSVTCFYTYALPSLNFFVLYLLSYVDEEGMNVARQIPILSS